jgi:hypothetical protein
MASLAPVLDLPRHLGWNMAWDAPRDAHPVGSGWAPTLSLHGPKPEHSIYFGYRSPRAQTTLHRRQFGNRRLPCLVLRN